MPFSRPTLSELKAQVAADVQANLQGVSALLRNSVLRVITVVQAGLAYLHYGYLDWIAKQAVPWTATDEYIVGWGALKNVYQKGAAPASGTATFQGSAGNAVAAGMTVVRGDGRTYDGISAGFSARRGWELRRWNGAVSWNGYSRHPVVRRGRSRLHRRR
jgi:uncharacterized phage protein gp47/JayE